MISTNFTFNNITSESMGIYLIRNNSGLFPISYVSSKNISEEFPRKARSPYFYGIQYNQPTIKMMFSTLTNDMTYTKLKTIASWLFKEDYKEFVSEDNADKIYYLLAMNQSDFMTNGNNEGYFEVEFQSKYPYALTASATPTYNIVGSGSIVLNNECNVYDYYYPQLEITINSGSTVSLSNFTDESRVSSFTGLSVGEVLTIDNEKKQITSSTGNYRYDVFNKNWFRLYQGVNYINVTGNVSLKFTTQFPIFT